MGWAGRWMLGGHNTHPFPYDGGLSKVGEETAVSNKTKRWPWLGRGRGPGGGGKKK